MILTIKNKIENLHKSNKSHDIKILMSFLEYMQSTQDNTQKKILNKIKMIFKKKILRKFKMILKKKTLNKIHVI